MRQQLKNSVSALLLQIITVAVGLIVPRLMIAAFGSNVNGLVNSIHQFLSYAALIEGGVGGVIKAALYKSIAAKDNDSISSILKAAEIFFRKVAMIFLGYIAVLMVVYPYFINRAFDAWFMASLIAIMAISSVTQYFFGLTYSMFLQANKKNYICNMLQIGTYLLNAVLTVILIYVGASIHIVKLASAAAFVITPIALNLYVRRNYPIDRKAKPDTIALSQRWNGMAHHIAWFLHTNTDVAIITFMGSLVEVSVYSIYYMVASSMTKLIAAAFNGMEPLLGNILAADGEEKTRNTLNLYTMCRNTFVIILFTTAGAMLMPFISLYTMGITDADYDIPLLGYMLLLAEGFYCMRVPYHSVATAAGHFKQTQGSAILETILNISMSVLLFIWMGLPGVAIATAIAMLYRTVYYVGYLSQNLIHISFGKNIRNIGAASITVVITILVLRGTVMLIPTENYFVWVLQAVISGMIAILVSLIYARMMYQEEFRMLLNWLKSKR